MDPVNCRQTLPDPAQKRMIRGPETCPPDSANVPWSELTKSPEKVQAYKLDTEFRLVWDEIRRADPVFRTALIEECGLLLFKPEALVSDALGEAMLLCTEMGFRIFFCEETRMDGGKLSLLWHYQDNNATVDRIRAVHAIFGDRPCMVAAVRRGRVLGYAPTCVALSKVAKGSAFKAGRDRQTMRGVFGCPNPVISFVHVGDEPADMIRDMGILLTWQQRRTLYRALSAETTLAVDAIATAVRGRYPRYDFDVQNAVGRLRRSLETTGIHHQSQRAALDALARAEAFDEYLDAWAFLENLEASGAITDPWDCLVTVTSFIVRRHDGTRHFLVPPLPEEWGRLT
jgi:hypothetical protein